jgi:hypothetical protein
LFSHKGFCYAGKSKRLYPLFLKGRVTVLTTTENPNTAASVVAGDPAVAKLISDAKSDLLADVQTAHAAIDKIFDAAVTGEALVLTDAENAAVSVALDFVPPGARDEVKALVAALVSSEENKVNPAINAGTVKALHSAQAWIDAFFTSAEKSL